jgi:hypothetical protein
MKYFTLKRDVTEKQLTKYLKYQSSIKDKFPPQYFVLTKKIILHDAEVYQITFNGKELSFSISARDIKSRQGNIESWYSVVMVYSQVSELHYSKEAKNDYQLKSLGRLLYDEIEILRGKFQHRVLFESGMEFEVTFEKFDFKVGKKLKTYKLKTVPLMLS